MKYEVEQKYRSADPAAIEAWLAARGVQFAPSLVQVDTDLAHPCRDFAATDEALRVRSVGEENCVTYKGPKIDATTKTRRELEIPIESGAVGAAHFSELLAAIGFRPVAVVRKRRRTASVSWRSHSVEIALDDVDGIGAFCELEVSAEADQIDAARQALTEVARELDLADSDRRSYLELLLAQK